MLTATEIIRDQSYSPYFYRCLVSFGKNFGGALMCTTGNKNYMADPTTGKHHRNPKGASRLWRHYSNTCNIYEFNPLEVIQVDFVNRGAIQPAFSSATEVRVVTSSKGLVVVLYFDSDEESHILFLSYKLGQNIAPGRTWSGNQISRKTGMLNLLIKQSITSFGLLSARRREMESCRSRIMLIRSKRHLKNPVLIVEEPWKLPIQNKEESWMFASVFW